MSVFSAAAPLRVYATEEKGHGRVEKSKCSILDAKLIEKEGMYEEWPGLKHIIAPPLKRHDSVADLMRSSPRQVYWYSPNNYLKSTRLTLH